MSLHCRLPRAEDAQVKIEKTVSYNSSLKAANRQITTNYHVMPDLLDISYLHEVYIDLDFNVRVQICLHKVF